MLPFTILNAKEKKSINALLEQQWGFTKKLDYVYLMNRKNRIFFTNRDIERLDTKALRVNSAGVYVGELLHDKELRLSIEGSQLIGKHATKNVVEISKEQMRQWLKGNDLDIDGLDATFVIIRCGDDLLGSGKVKEGRILNFVPKTRRILAPD